MPPQPDYRIYPSLLDKFQDLLDYEIVADEPWNKSGDDYKLTPDEMYYKIEAELIDMINRVEGVPIEAADRGTAFNEIVDCLIEKKPCRRKDMKIRSCKATDTQTVIIAEINGFTFVYDADFCKEVAARFPGSLTQYLCEGEMQTSRGRVLLYGYLDEWVGNKLYDLKTTGYYSFGKFERKWQRHTYPWCVIESGMATEIESFEYTVVVFPKGQAILKGEIYPEVYTYDHAQSTALLRAHIEAFIDWLESRRKYITNPRIFGGKLPEGYVGIPIDINLLKAA